MMEKKRKVSDIFDVMSEFGGILKVLQLTFGVLIYPISRFLFLLVMIKRLYFAKTKEEQVFLK